VIAIMDINPSNPGHVLVIPRMRSEDISKTHESDLAAVAVLCKKMGILQKHRIGAAGFNIL
jgi:histidine triad (HIT) family protein